jgi:hypothetical protein
MTLLSGAMAMVLSMAGVSSTQENAATAPVGESAMPAQQHAAPAAAASSVVAPPVVAVPSPEAAAAAMSARPASVAPAGALTHASATPTPAAPVTLAAGASRIPANTALILETQQALSSLTLKRGEKFALRLAEPLLLDGVQLLPAGTPGIGEVVHAERSRSGGKAGELILAARYLEHEGRRIPLRSFRIGVTGVDHTRGALAVAMALGPLAALVRGGNIEVPAQTRAQALTSQDVDLSAPVTSHTSTSTSSPSAGPISPIQPVPPNIQPSGEAVQ